MHGQMGTQQWNQQWPYFNVSTCEFSYGKVTVQKKHNVSLEFVGLYQNDVFVKH